MSRFMLDAQDEIWRVDDFDQWRSVSRHLLRNSVAPNRIHWVSGAIDQATLFAFRTVDDLPLASAPSECSTTSNTRAVLHVSTAFLDLAKMVACHSVSSRWALLYEAIWRIAHGERHLLDLPADELSRTLLRMQKQVRRDCHKMKAFVRFKKVAADPETYIAYHRPDHNIIRLVAPFFARRFQGMNWTILTPAGSATWDGEKLTYGPAVSVRESPDDDDLVSLWKEYYRSIFNPARIKINAMKKEMPVRFWKLLPETSEIGELLKNAPQRVEEMHDRAQRLHRSALAFIPPEVTLPQLSDAVLACRGCDLCENGTRAVPGVGPVDAPLMIVGEQPGDMEEKQGCPFVGPAGQLLDELLHKVNLDRSAIYMTNVVKHFHHEPRGKQRLHKRPSARHESACLPWLHREVDLVRPRRVLALGVTAMHALLGREFKLTQVLANGDKPVRSWASNQTFVSWHPAAILRVDATSADVRRGELLKVLGAIASDAKS